VTAESRQENVVAAKYWGVNSYIVKTFNVQTRERAHFSPKFSGADNQYIKILLPMIF